MEIFNLLDRSNCRQCYEKTCLAFAAAVFKGRRRLDECARLPETVIEKYSGNTAGARSVEEEMQHAVMQLKQKIAAIDLASAAARIGGGFLKGRLSIRVMGKRFEVDEKGNLSSEIHVNPWIAIPVLTYIIGSAARPVCGKWVSLRELKNGSIRYPLFCRRCEEPLRKVADSYPDLFKDLLEIFAGTRIESQSGSDVSLVLNPLPLVPVLISYWPPGDGFASDLHIFFDQTAEANLEIDALYTLTLGLVNMFEKLALRHGKNNPGISFS